jgi:AAA domain, putative AbiEii toxin, Type IV TA system
MKYGSQDMGLGEYALLISLWTLNNVSTNSIVVLEEPETHISARSQNALMDLVAWACDRRGLCVVITTHSPVVLQRIPKENIRLLVSNAGKSTVVPNPHRHQIASIVGGGVAYRNLLLVEDECAEQFVQVLLEQLDLDLKQQSVCVVMRGHSEIKTILSTLPPIDKWSKIVGIYDGDMRNQLNSADFHWPHLFLPGLLAPEQLLRSEALTEPGRASLVELLHCEAHRVEIALNAAAGLDHHDWLKQFVHAMDFDRTVVLGGLVRVWLKANISAAQKFTDELRQVIG